MVANPLTGRPMPSPHAFSATRHGLHQIAEQVLAQDRYRQDGRIGLQASPGGFSSPWEIVDGAKRCVQVVGTDIVLVVGDDRTSQPITTVATAAAMLGIEAGAPPVYRAATPANPGAVIALDPDAAAIIADWFEFGAVALERFLAAHPELAERVVGPTLWPEHFDLAVTIADAGQGELVIGVSPGDSGDSGDAAPYAYVSWQGVDRDDTGQAVDPWWNRLWGRWVPAEDLGVADDLVQLFEEGLTRSRRSSRAGVDG